MKNKITKLVTQITKEEVKGKVNVNVKLQDLHAVPMQRHEVQFQLKKGNYGLLLKSDCCYGFPNFEDKKIITKEVSSGNGYDDLDEIYLDKEISGQKEIYHYRADIEVPYSDRGYLDYEECFYYCLFTHKELSDEEKEKLDQDINLFHNGELYGLELIEASTGDTVKVKGIKNVFLNIFNGSEKEIRRGLGDAIGNDNVVVNDWKEEFSFLTEELTRQDNK